MPNRLVREGFLDSEAVHALSDAAECFYHRLLLAADDAGRMDGRVEVLRARLFPLDSSRRASDVEKCLAECLQQALVIPYEWDRRRLLQLTKWQRVSPCKTSRYPWKDGSFDFTYTKLQTRDGVRDYVTTSIPIPIPSLSHTDGIEPLVSPYVGDGDGDGDGNDLYVGTDAPTAGHCPIQKIIQLYHTKLPELPKVEKMTDAREGYIRQRWREDLKSLDEWGNYFDFIRLSDFLMGRAPGRDGKQPFIADLEWITRPGNYAKIAEEKYHRG
jgi:hypothetical protein